MQRRALLTAMGLSAVSVAGCLSDRDTPGSPESDGSRSNPTGDNGPGADPSESNGSGTDSSESDGSGSDPTESDGVEDRRYEECSREVIRYETFPTEVQAEIDAALDGTHEADRIYLQETMDVDASYVAVDGTYYDPSVESGSDGETLTLRPVEPKALPRARPVSVELDRDGERTVTIEAVAADGTELFARSRTIYSGGSVEFGRIARVGSHELRITVTADETVETETTETARIDESHFDVIVVVAPDDVFVTGTVAELVPCRFDA